MTRASTATALAVVLAVIEGGCTSDADPSRSAVAAAAPPVAQVVPPAGTDLRWMLLEPTSLLGAVVACDVRSVDAEAAAPAVLVACGAGAHQSARVLVTGPPLVAAAIRPDTQIEVQITAPGDAPGDAGGITARGLYLGTVGLRPAAVTAAAPSCAAAEGATTGWDFGRFAAEPERYRGSRQRCAIDGVRGVSRRLAGFPYGARLWCAADGGRRGVAVGSRSAAAILALDPGQLVEIEVRDLTEDGDVVGALRRVVGPTAEPRKRAQ